MSAEFNIGSLFDTRIFNNFVGDSDFRDTYSFSLTSTVFFNAALTGLSADADFRLIWDNNGNGIIDAGDQEITRSQEFGTADESINRILTAGNYIIDTYQYSGNTNYTLALSTVDATSILPPSNLLPREINIGTLNGTQTFNGLIDNNNTVDTYRFSLTSPRRFDLSLTGLSADADVRLIRDANNNGIIDVGEEISRPENGGNASEFISRDVLAAGDYFVQVYQFIGDTNYTLSLSATNPVVPPNIDLVGQFGNVNLPDTIEFRDDGTARVIVTNRGNTVAQGPVTVNLYISTDDNIDRNAYGELQNDALLATLTGNINLQPGQSAIFTLPYENITSVIAPGGYNLIAEINSPTITESNEFNNATSLYVSAPNTDVVIDWNAIALNAIQAEGEFNSRGIAPTEGSRLLAITHAAIYDAVNAFEQTHTPYAVDIVAPFGASIEAAAVGAAYQSLVTLLPNHRELFDTQLVRSLGEINDSQTAEATGVAFGQFVANQILALRANDGSDDNTPYVPPQGDYVWQPDVGGFALSPNWGNVTPFGIPDVDWFAPDGLDGTLGTDLYAQEIEEVRILGAREDTALTNVIRTADQTEIAHFWAYDRADTFRPYGQLNQIAEEVAVREDNTLAENARLFAQLNIALADAAIVAWDAKYDYVQPRPDDVIAEGIAANDGIAFTVGDPDWQPLLDSPAFPDYISGHTTFAGAFAGVMTNFFGDNYEFTAVSQELIGTTRTFGSFLEAAEEDGLSRIYGGIHVREATVTDALPAGYNVGDFVANNIAQPLYA
jgi:hypothetical protein